MEGIVLSLLVLVGTPLLAGCSCCLSFPTGLGAAVHIPSCPLLLFILSQQGLQTSPSRLTAGDHASFRQAAGVHPGPFIPLARSLSSSQAPTLSL